MDFLRDASLFRCPANTFDGVFRFLQSSGKIEPQVFPDATAFLARNAAKCDGIDSLLSNEDGHHRYGCIGLRDRRMEPISEAGQSGSSRCIGPAATRSKMVQ